MAERPALVGFISGSAAQVESSPVQSGEERRLWGWIPGTGRYCSDGMYFSKECREERRAVRTGCE